MDITDMVKVFGEVLEGDCIEVMGSDVPNNSVDFINADPPYNLSINYNSYDDKMDDAAYKEWCVQWMNGCYDSLKPRSYCVLWNSDINMPLFLDAIQRSKLTFSHFLKWHKPTAQNRHFNTVLFVRTELGCICYKDTPTNKCLDYRRLWADTVSHETARSKHSKEKGSVNHPCRRPIDLYSNIIGGFCNAKYTKNPIVLDPFMGSGTTGCACIRLGFDYIGIEIDPVYVKMAKERIEEEREQWSLLSGEKNTPQTFWEAVEG